MRITGITFVGTRTDVRPAMSRFVREVLGLTAAPAVDGMDADLFVDARRLVVRGDARRRADRGRPHGRVPRGRPRRRRRVLLASGVEVDEEISTNARFRYLHFRAPDGHLYELLEERG